MARIWIAQTTTDSEAAARALSEQAVREKLAACAHIDGPFTSVYSWKNEVACGPEWRLTFKTSSRALTALQAWLLQEHAFETPQWVWWEAEASDDYAEWVAETTRPPT